MPPNSDTLGQDRFDTISSTTRELVALAAELGIRKGTAELEEIDLDGLEAELAEFLDVNAETLVGASYDYLEGLVRKSLFADLDERAKAAIPSALGPELVTWAELAADELEEIAQIKRDRDALERQVLDGLSRIARGALTMGLSAVLAI